MRSRSRPKRSLWRRITGIFTRHLPQKVIALIAALLLWFFVSDMMIGKKGTIQGVELRVTLPEGYLLLSDKFPEISLDIDGSEGLVSEALPKDFLIEYNVSASDLSQNGESLNLLLKPEMVRKKSSWLTVSEIRPQNIPIRADKKVTREKPLRVVTAGDLSPGFYASCTAIPSVIPVTGPESILRRIPSIPLTPIPLDKAMSETFFITNHPVELPHPSLQSDVHGAEVTVSILRRGADRTLSNLPVHFLSSSGITLPQAPSCFAEVKVKGSLEALQVLAPHYLRVFADFPAATRTDSGFLDIPLRVWCIDPTVQIDSVSPLSILFLFF